MGDVRDVPRDVQDALRSGMRLEGIGPSEFDDLLWIMAHESSGKVNSRNPPLGGYFNLIRVITTITQMGQDLLATLSRKRGVGYDTFGSDIGPQQLLEPFGRNIDGIKKSRFDNLVASYSQRRMPSRNARVQ